MENQNLYIFSFSKYLLHIIIMIILIGFTLSFAFQNLVIFSSQTNGASKVNKILSETLITEIPIFGSSRALRNFVPSEIDENCFNYGIDGAQANIWLFFLEQELKKKKSTPILINFDLRGLVYKDGDVSNYIPNWNNVKYTLKHKDVYYYKVPFIKYYGEFEKYFNSYTNEKVNLTSMTDNGGSFLKNKLIKSKFDNLVKKRENIKTTFSLKKKLLAKLNELISHSNRKIIFVVSPYHKSFFNKFQNINEANKYLSGLSLRENVDVVDLRKYINDDDMFFDPMHLNYKGSIKFTRRLKEELRLLIKDGDSQ